MCMKINQQTIYLFIIIKSMFLKSGAMERFTHNQLIKHVSTQFSSRYFMNIGQIEIGLKTRPREEQ